MRKLDSLLPQASQDDIFGQHAIAAAKRAAEIGYQAWLEEEAANPSWADPDWCRMVVARLNDQVPTFSDDTQITFRCPRCRDTGFVRAGSFRKFGLLYETFAKCGPCAFLVWEAAETLRNAEQEGKKPRGRLRAFDDPGGN